jgi:serine protease Do
MRIYIGRKNTVLNVNLILISIFLFLIIFSLQGYAKESDDLEALKRTSKAFSKVAKSASPAVVFVKVEKTIERDGNLRFHNDPFDLFNDEFFRRFFAPRRPEQRKKKYREMGQGSGFIISKDGYILTNNHVIGDADKIMVKMYDKRELEAEVVGTDPRSDVAVIKIKESNLPFLSLGNSDLLDVGEWVIAIGNPFGLIETVTVGVISAKGRSTLGLADYENFLQTDAAINPGNSGGPLINLEGKVIGINTAIFSRSGGYMGIGFAIPINMAKKIKDQLIKTGKVTRGYLGIVIQELTEDIADSFALKNDKGLIVAEVSEDSPADKAGLKQGDIILKLNGDRVEGIGPFRNKISMTPPGTKVNLNIYRDGKIIDKKVTTGDLPEKLVASASQGELFDKLGFSVKELTQV